MNASGSSANPTVAAISTAAGTGAVAMIRISGPEAIAVAAKVCGDQVSTQAAHETRHCKVRDDKGDVIDDGLLTVMRSPKSYTGEDTVEFTGHGGILVSREVLARFFECGAEAAGPGEFTRRAFLNGKLDLTQAEGVMDLISAQTKLALKAARGQLEGHLGKQTTEARDELLGCLAHLEAFIDFPDEDIDPQTGKELNGRVQAVLDTTTRLLATADQGRILREGVRTVIYGPPNVGKSSLLNHLLGFDRAIVSETAGTTRDTIEETINLDGLPLRLIDTAGMREADDAIEAEGIQRTVHQIEQADLLLEVADGSAPRSEDPASHRESSKHVLILNKCDLGEDASWSDIDAVRVSCLEKNGFDQLAKSIHETLQFNAVDWGEHQVAINARHQQSLLRAQEALKAALHQMDPQSTQAELAAIDLREALDALGEIPGKVDTEDLLGVIFSSFCIGK